MAFIKHSKLTRLFQVFFLLCHSMKTGNINLVYELDNRPAPIGERLFELTFLPVDVRNKRSLTITHLLAMYDLLTLSERQVPEFFSNALFPSRSASFGLVNSVSDCLTILNLLNALRCCQLFLAFLTLTTLFCGFASTIQGERRNATSICGLEAFFDLSASSVRFRSRLEPTHCLLLQTRLATSHLRRVR